MSLIMKEINHSLTTPRLMAQALPSKIISFEFVKIADIASNL